MNIVDRLPIALQPLIAFPNWVLYRADKIPLRAADGFRASSTNPADWCDFDTAWNAAQTNPGVGIGFVLSENDPFTVIDLDTYKTKDPNIIASHNEIFKSFNTYTELSPSKGGAHLWVRGKIPSSKKFDQGCIEMYDRARYMTVTFNPVNNVPIEACQQLLDELWKDIDKHQHSNPAPEHTIYDVPPTEDDATIAHKVELSHPQLWMCDANEEGNRSKLDYQLCKEIVCVSRNRQQSFRVFMLSPRANTLRLYRTDQNRNKCVNRPQYVLDTIEQAFTSTDWLAEELRRNAGNQGFKVESGFSLPNQRRAIGRTGEEIPDEPTVWLFPNLIPRGHISVLAGEGGAGKSTLSLSFAAELTKRGSKVLIWSSEDIASQTIKPRLSAMGAIKANYTIVESTINEMGVKQIFDPSTDLPLLEVMAKEMGGIDLLIVDSVLEVVPAKENPFIATVVRKAFQPLLMLIQKLNCGCIGILHFTKDSANKKPVDRIMNSRAFTDVARMNLAAAMDEETQECIFTRVKTNIAPLGGGFKYRLERMKWNNDKGEVIEAQYVQWGEEIKSSNPRAILAAVSYDPKKKDLPEGVHGTDRLEAAKSWLLSLLTQEPVSVKALPSLTQSAGLSWSVVDCAKRILERTGKVKTGPIGYGGQHFLQIVV